MTKFIEEYLNRMAASTELAFYIASFAYLLNFLEWLFCLPIFPDGWQHCAYPLLNNITGVIRWMGGPVDIGFYTFIASEGISMIFANMERKRMDREREEWKAELKWNAKRERRQKRKLRNSWRSEKMDMSPDESATR